MNILILSIIGSIGYFPEWRPKTPFNERAENIIIHSAFGVGVGFNRYNPATKISLQLQMMNDNIVVQINSKAINWDTNLIQPNMEYLLLPEIKK